VDCPQPGCIGLGYLGQETVMCFVCEHQWAVELPVTADVAAEVSAAGVKACPGCGLLIMKNGGCDHMTCRCRHNFWWTTLQPYPGCRCGGNRCRFP
jgi:hypothetical protein